MVLPQDALMTLSHKRYGPDYLTGIYTKMAAHVPPNAFVAEIGCRLEDRGVISKRIIPHAGWMPIDKDAKRAHAVDGLAFDVLEVPVEADVIISTCILHHTAESDIPRLLSNMCAPVLMFTGPNADVLPELFGDHKWHIEIGKLIRWLGELEYRVHWERIGLTQPYCELFILAQYMKAAA